MISQLIVCTLAPGARLCVPHALLLLSTGHFRTGIVEGDPAPAYGVY